MPKYLENRQRPPELRAQQSAALRSDALSRRGALKLAAGIVAFTHGNVIVAQNMAQMPNVQQYAQRSLQTMLVALDGIDAIAFQYRGRRVNVSPSQLLDAMEGK